MSSRSAIDRVPPSTSQKMTSRPNSESCSVDASVVFPAPFGPKSTTLSPHLSDTSDARRKRSEMSATAFPPSPLVEIIVKLPETHKRFSRILSPQSHLTRSRSLSRVGGVTDVVLAVELRNNAVNVLVELDGLAQVLHSAIPATGPGYVGIGRLTVREDDLVHVANAPVEVAFPQSHTVLRDVDAVARKERSLPHRDRAWPTCADTLLPSCRSTPSTTCRSEAVSARSAASWQCRRRGTTRERHRRASRRRRSSPSAGRPSGEQPRSSSASTSCARHRRWLPSSCVRPNRRWSHAEANLLLPHRGSRAESRSRLPVGCTPMSVRVGGPPSTSRSSARGRTRLASPSPSA